MNTKTCITCSCTKPLDSFYRNKNMTSGRLNRCIECSKREQSKRRSENHEKAVENDRRYHRKYLASDAGKAASASRRIAYRANQPKRAFAHYAVSQAVRAGKLEKHPCWVCGAKAEAHHPDYDRPLDVVWLCSLHHKQAHALVAEAEGQQWRREFGAQIVG